MGGRRSLLAAVVAMGVVVIGASLALAQDRVIDPPAGQSPVNRQKVGLALEVSMPDQLPERDPSNTNANRVLAETGSDVQGLGEHQTDGYDGEIKTVADLIGHLSTYSQEYLCFLGDDVVVRFAYPGPTVELPGFVVITDIYSVSDITLRNPAEVVNEDGSISKETGEMVHGRELIVQRHYRTDEAGNKLEALLADSDLMGRIISGPQQCREAIPEPSARVALRMITLGGPPEVVPGFGGLYLDPNDNSIAYVYMLDPSQQEEARRAAEMVLGAQRFARETREVRTVQAQYSMSQLSRWYKPVSLFFTEGMRSVDLNERKNRIVVDLYTEEARPRVEEELDRLGIPREAVEIVVNPEPIRMLPRWITCEQERPFVTLPVIRDDVKRICPGDESNWLPPR